MLIGVPEPQNSRDRPKSPALLIIYRANTAAWSDGAYPPKTRRATGHESHYPAEYRDRGIDSKSNATNFRPVRTAAFLKDKVQRFKECVESMPKGRTLAQAAFMRLGVSHLAPYVSKFSCGLSFSRGKLKSLLQQRRPVDHNCYRRRAAFERNVQQESVSIGRYGIRLSQCGSVEPCLEEWSRSLGVEARASADGDRHQFPVGRQVEQLSSVAAPSRLGAALGRDLPFASQRWERLDVDLRSTRLVRYVCDPLDVWRKLALTLVELTVKYR